MYDWKYMLKAYRAACVHLFLFTLLVTLTSASPGPTNGDVKLNQINQSSQKLLQVYYDGQFSTVCMINFTEFTANTVCKQLGYSGADNFSAIDNTNSEG